MSLPTGLARFNRRVTNRLTRPFAGRLPGFAIVVHTGRSSGRTYRTPVNAFRDGSDYRIALTYGPETDWVRNVLSADGCTLVTRGRPIALARPRLVTDSSMTWAPPPVRLILGLVGVSQYLRLTPVPASDAAGSPAQPAAAGQSSR